MTTDHKKYEEEIDMANYIIEVGSDDWLFDIDARTVLPLAKAFLEILQKLNNKTNE